MKNKWKKFKEWYKKDIKRNLLLICMSFLCVIGLVLNFLPSDPSPDSNDKKSKKSTEEISYIEFEKMLKNEKVEEVTINLTSPTFTFTDKENFTFKTANPKTENFKEVLLKANVKVDEIDKSTQNEILALIRSFLPLLFIAFLIIYLSKSMKPGGKTKSKQVSTIPNTVFDHIAGNEQSKEEMKFLVEFLKKPSRFTKMGAKLPKGVILYGPPGTGKTLTAKAIAGEAGVPFFSLSGSDFVEMYVGLGARRVRELFEEARKKAPAIIFIDEIDSVGSNRDSTSNSEDRKTLNAILNEMDGFKENSGIVVIGATNKLEDLDPAFVRPGRFDKTIAIALPDLKGRQEILKIHAKNKPLASNVDLQKLAKITLGMSGAYLETILNEATILATSRNQTEVTEADIDDAYYKMIVKGHKKKRTKEEENEELEIVAWHEAGHALVAKLLDTSDVPKVTVTPSTTGIGGFALITPKKQTLHSKEYLRNKVKELYAGRIAEHLLLKNEQKITMGASQDIKQATDTIKKMILDYGMSDTFGMLNLSLLGDSRQTSLHQNELFVQEATRLSKELYNEAYALLSDNLNILQAIAEKLIEEETILEEELESIIDSFKC